MFGGAELELLRAAALPAHPRLARLGPDILGPGFTAEDGVAALRGADPAAALGEALLDQSLIAGIGNVCKSEDSSRPASTRWRVVGGVGDEESVAVVESTAELMRGSVETGRRRRPGPQPRPPAVPALQDADSLPRPGRRQSRHLLVSRV